MTGQQIAHGGWRTAYEAERHGFLGWRFWPFWRPARDCCTRMRSHRLQFPQQIDPERRSRGFGTTGFVSGHGNGHGYGHGYSRRGAQAAVGRQSADY